MIARSWLSIEVELVSGLGADFWPRPGRLFAVAKSLTFSDFAEAIDRAFGRWDLSHLHMFTLADGSQITPLCLWDSVEPEGSLDGDKTTLRRLKAGEQFAYVFDFGDDWTHLCTVRETRVDAEGTFGEVPDGPVVCFGWGDLPDQYGRRWADDGGHGPEPKRPRKPFADLPPLLPGWGPARRR